MPTELLVARPVERRRHPIAVRGASRGRLKIGKWTAAAGDARSSRSTSGQTRETSAFKRKSADQHKTIDLQIDINVNLLTEMSAGRCSRSRCRKKCRFFLTMQSRAEIAWLATVNFHFCLEAIGKNSRSCGFSAASRELDAGRHVIPTGSVPATGFPRVVDQAAQWRPSRSDAYGLVPRIQSFIGGRG